MKPAPRTATVTMKATILVHLFVNPTLILPSFGCRLGSNGRQNLASLGVVSLWEPLMRCSANNSLTLQDCKCDDELIYASSGTESNPASRTAAAPALLHTD